jgi:hypothetical protein
VSKKKKPAPINRKLHKEPPKKAVPEKAPEAFNAVSPIIEQQMKRAERAVDNLREEVKELRARPPKVQVNSESPKVEVTLPERPRISKVTIKYDQLGFPSELIPQYSKPAV